MRLQIKLYVPVEYHVVAERENEKESKKPPHTKTHEDTTYCGGDKHGTRSCQRNSLQLPVRSGVSSAHAER